MTDDLFKEKKNAIVLRSKIISCPINKQRKKWEKNLKTRTLKKNLVLF